MDRVELYREVFTSFRTLCAEGKQTCSFDIYCKEHGVRQSYMRTVLRDEFQNVTSLPGYMRCSNQGTCGIGIKCHHLYEEFKKLCANGKQPSSFASYYRNHGVSKRQMRDYMMRKGKTVVGLPGFKGPRNTAKQHYKEVPFEDVIFEEAGFLPADSGNVITVKVDGHVAVSFPADTDVAVIARFVRKMRKGAGDVGV